MMMTTNTCIVCQHCEAVRGVYACFVAMDVHNQFAAYIVKPSDKCELWMPKDNVKPLGTRNTTGTAGNVVPEHRTQPGQTDGGNK